MAAPYVYWTMFGGPDPTTTPSSLAPTPTVPASSTAPAPVYHSVITGTYDPTPAEIIAAAAASGVPVPSGMDPVEYSRLMSGLSPISMSAPASVPPLSSAPSGLPTSLPISTAPGVAPWAGIHSLSSEVSGSPFASAMKTLSFNGGGGLLCDPITGKCPPYR